MVSAIACAQIDRALQQTGGDNLRQRLQNILATATILLADNAKCPDSEVDGSNYSSDEGDVKEAASDDLEPGPLPAPGLPLLRRVINQILAMSSKGAATAAAVTPAAASAPSSSTSALHAGLALPPRIVRTILSRLDSLSAAKAAASCKQLNNLHKQLRYFDPSPAARGYAQSVQGVQEAGERCSDGSCEASFVCAWPLDGSGVCGSDLEDEAAGRGMLATLPRLIKYGALKPEAIAAMEAEVKEKKEGNTR